MKSYGRSMTFPPSFVFIHRLHSEWTEGFEDLETDHILVSFWLVTAAGEADLMHTSM